VLDSFSTDSTLEVARQFRADIHQHRFKSYAAQRNRALDLPIRSEWILFLDADEWLPEPLKEEIATVLSSNPLENGFYMKRRLIWMGRWIRRGYYPTWILRLFRRGKARCEQRGINPHLIVQPPVGFLKQDFVHEDHRGLSSWIARHNDYAACEAEELLRRKSGAKQEEIPARLFGTQAEQKRWLRHKVWERLPPLLRPFFYFGYRYFLRCGFLDGKEAFLYHFFQALWFPLLIDAKYLEACRKHRPPRPLP